MKDDMPAKAVLASIISLMIGIYLGAVVTTIDIKQDCQQLGAFHSERVVYDCKERK